MTDFYADLMDSEAFWGMDAPRWNHLTPQRSAEDLERTRKLVDEAAERFAELSRSRT